MFRHCSFPKRLSVLVVPALLVLGHATLQAAPITVTSAISPSGGNWAYSVSITNLSATDPYGELASVDFTLPSGSLVGTPVAPAGNGTTSDPGQNFVEFSSNNLTGFTLGQTVSGFWFMDTASFSSLTFTANYLNHAETVLTPFTGTVPTVPEPATMGLFAVASLLLFSRVRSLRKS